MKRPTPILVFGILNIIFAAFGAISVLMALILFNALPDSTNPVVQLIHTNAAYRNWMKFSVGLGTVVIPVLLAAGIGLLKLKPWARVLSILYGICAIVMVFAGGFINYFFLVQPLMAKAQTAQGPEAAGAMAGAIGGTFGSCLGLVYPILLLIFMFRPNIIAAFQPGGSGAATPPPL